MNSKSLLLRTGSGSIPVHLPTVSPLSCSIRTLSLTKLDRHKMGAYYKEMINSDSTNSLLLRNYATYLHQVEGDAVKAEEYYGRAILASPGDGQLLSLYGNLIWETQGDESRATSYFNHALQASPHDSMVLGSYAHFLWEIAGEKQMETNKIV